MRRTSPFPVRINRKELYSVPWLERCRAWPGCLAYPAIRNRQYAEVTAGGGVHGSRRPAELPMKLCLAGSVCASRAAGGSPSVR